MKSAHDETNGSQSTISEVTTTKEDQLLMLKYCDNEMAWRKSAKQDASR